MSDMSNEPPESQAAPPATPTAVPPAPASVPSDTPIYATPVERPMPDRIQSEARSWAMAAHLAALGGLVVPFGNIIGPFVVWRVKKDQFPLVDDQGKESLNFQISMTIYLLAAAILMIVGIGFLLVPVIAVVDLIFVIIASIEVNNKGTPYRYPLTIRLVK
jgi:uncharacterized Tic20 family protein